MKRPSTKLRQKFIDGLAEYGLTHDEVKKNWKYAGGDSRHHLNYSTCAMRTFSRPIGRTGASATMCIRENCYITDGTWFLVVGNCCIKKFLDKQTRTCDMWQATAQEQGSKSMQSVSRRGLR
jgi:hypothetical protein